MIDMKRATQIMNEHFDKVTPDEFMENVKKYCPELLEQSPESESKAKSSRVGEAFDFIELHHETYGALTEIARSQNITPETVIENWIKDYSSKQSLEPLATAAA